MKNYFKLTTGSTCSNALAIVKTDFLKIIYIGTTLKCNLGWGGYILYCAMQIIITSAKYQWSLICHGSYTRVVLDKPRG